MGNKQPLPDLSTLDNLPSVQPSKRLSVPTVVTMLRKGYGKSAIARAHNVATSTLSDYLQRHDDEIQDLLGYDDVIRELLKDKILMALRAMTPAKAEKESFFYLARAIDTAVKAVELLEGRATERVDTGRLTQQLQDIRSEREALERQLARMEDGTVDITPSESISESEPENDSAPQVVNNCESLIEALTEPAEKPKRAKLVIPRSKPGPLPKSQRKEPKVREYWQPLTPEQRQAEADKRKARVLWRIDHGYDTRGRLPSGVEYPDNLK